MKDIKSIADYLGWGTYFDSNERITFSQYSPAGEDFSFTVDIEDVNNLEQITKQVKEYADGFDVNEHAEMWLPQRGKGGCPDSLKGLLEDAESIQEMLNEFANFMYLEKYKLI